MPRQSKAEESFEFMLSATVEFLNLTRPEEDAFTMCFEGPNTWSLMGGYRLGQLTDSQSTSCEWYEIRQDSPFTFTVQSLAPVRRKFSFKARNHGRYLHVDLYSAIRLVSSNTDSGKK